MSNSLGTALAVATVVAAFSGCGDDDGGAGSSADASEPDASQIDAMGESPDAASLPDAAPSADANPMPMNLAGTGLYSDVAADIIADGVRAFEPEHILWTDSATKRRWVWLPPGTTIDSSDMDFWTYPVGTKLWKEFTRDGVRVETRMLSKLGDGDWFMMAYAWNAGQTEALAVPDGVMNALGTSHDIPTARQCRTCHSRQPDVSIGFTAIQLDHPDATAGRVTLDTLVQENLLTAPPSGSAPYFDIPGDATQLAALGYLHANCGGCHNARSDVHDITPMELRLTVAALATVEGTSIYTTTVGVTGALSGVDGATILVDPSSADTSVIVKRMGRRGARQMPPLGTEDVDTAGLAAVTAWINSLTQ